MIDPEVLIEELDELKAARGRSADGLRISATTPT